MIPLPAPEKLTCPNARILELGFYNWLPAQRATTEDSPAATNTTFLLSPPARPHAQLQRGSIQYSVLVARGGLKENQTESSTFRHACVCVCVFVCLLVQ